MTWYTVFVQEADGRGTTHVSAYNVDELEHAVRAAIDETRDDWGRENYTDADLRVLGVIEGQPDIVVWSDYGIDSDIPIPPPEEDDDE